MDEESRKIAYLELVQEPINRMSSISAIIKGFCITVNSGLISLFFENKHILLLMINIFFVLVFMILDIYYFTIEKKYRNLYKQIIENKRNLDFSLQLIKDRKQTRAIIIECLKSFSIWFFYSLQSLLLIMIYILNIMEVF